jgi:hypothetical protein
MTFNSKGFPLFGMNGQLVLFLSVQQFIGPLVLSSVLNSMQIYFVLCRSYCLEDILLLLVYVYSLVGDESSDSLEEESNLQVFIANISLLCFN